MMKPNFKNKITERFSILLITLLLPYEAACATTPDERLIDRLSEGVASGRVMFGHHDDPVYGHTWKWDAGRSDVLEATGEYPAVMSWDLGGIENGDSVNLDGVSFDRIRQEAIAQNARGGINTFSWHLTTPHRKATSWEVTDSTVVNRILTNPEDNRWMTDALGAVADFLGSMRDSDGNRFAVIFRPWHEHTGSWFWWGAGLCTPDEYKTLWQLTRLAMDSKDVDNVVWAYSPDRVQGPDQYMERYPGDEYVDILGTDVYHFNGVEGRDTYIEDAGRSLRTVTDLARKHGKVPAFTETGLESITIPDWYTSTLMPLLKEYPVAYVTVWRNAHDNPKHYYTPYKGHPAVSDFRKFHDDPMTIFVPKQH